MTDYIKLSILIGFLLATYASAGYTFNRVLKLSQLGSGTNFFVGAGIVSAVSLFGSMLLPNYILGISKSVMFGALSIGVILIAWNMLKAGYSNEDLIQIPFYLILFVMVIPMLMGSFHVRFWGDETNMEATLVRYWLQQGDFFVDPKAFFSFYGHPRLWVIMLYQSLCLNGQMHEAAGRWLTVLIIFCGSMFVWKECTYSLKFGRWSSLICAAFWMTLVFGSMFAYSASWYYSIIVSILVMMSFYYVVVAHRSRNGFPDLKLVAISAIFMAMIVGIRPDGFLYLPLLLGLLFAGGLTNLRRTFRRNLLGGLIILTPSVIIYFAWQLYFRINVAKFSSSLDSTLNPLAILGRVNQLYERFWPVTAEMCSMAITEWDKAGFWFLTFALCSILAAYMYKYLNEREKCLLLLLTVPLYKFVLMIFVNSIFFTDTVRMSRHIMQTAPTIYFLLGVLIVKWIKIRSEGITAIWARRSRMILVPCFLAVVFILQLSIGLLYSHLPSDRNNLMEYWSDLIRKEHPEYKRVFLTGDGVPYSVWLAWRYHASDTPSVYAGGLDATKGIAAEDKALGKANMLDALHKDKIDAVLIYGGYRELERATGLKFLKNRVSLVELREEGFRIITSEEIPYNNILCVNYRISAVVSLVEDIKRYVIFLQ